jgi:hypothetical protein
MFLAGSSPRRIGGYGATAQDRTSETGHRENSRVMPSKRGLIDTGTDKRYV